MSVKMSDMDINKPDLRLFTSLSSNLHQEKCTSPAPLTSQSVHRPVAFIEGHVRTKTDVSFTSEQEMDPSFGFQKRIKLEASPAPTTASFKSEQSMNPFVEFQKSNVYKERCTSPTPSYLPSKSSQSMQRQVAFIEGHVRAKRQAPSPTLTDVSFKSEQSMDPLVGFHERLTFDHGPTTTWPLYSSQSMHRPVAFIEGNVRANLHATSPAPTVVSFKSEQSMDPLIGFQKRTKLQARSPAPTSLSFKSEQSMDPLIGFQRSNVYQERRKSPASSYVSMKSSQPMHRPIAFIEGHVRTNHEASSPSPSASFTSEQSMDPLGFQKRVSCPSSFMEDCLKCPACNDVLKHPVSIPCGDTFCKTCIQSYWTEPVSAGRYSCPQCRKRFQTRPSLNLNLALNQMLKQAGFSPALPAQSYAGPGDVACDICTGSKIRAVKWCLTCSAAYCETHVRQHYTVRALQRHRLTDVTGEPETRSCQPHLRALEVFCRTDQANSLTTDVQKLQFGSLSESGTKDEGQENNADLMDGKVQRAVAFLSYLTQMFCRRLEDANGFGSEFVEVAALGRDFDLGMLYDCRSDSCSSDVLLWEKDAISSTRLSIPRPQKDIRVLDGDSLNDRLTALDLTGPLRASVVSGLVEVAGASAFVNHYVQSRMQDRVTLRYRTSTRLDMLSHELLHGGFPLTVTSSTSATHVVVAVLYGSQAFFVFDSKKEGKAKNIDLKEVVEKMIDPSSQTALLSRLSERGESELYDCVPFVDGTVLKTPTYDAAEKVVPLKVWLYPLKNLDQTSACVAKHITEDQLSKAENILEQLQQDISFCHHLMSSDGASDVFTQVPALKNSLSEFSSLLQQHWKNFKKTLASCIKTIRETGPEEEEEKLRDLLDRAVRSPFSSRDTQQWLQNKSAEMRALLQCRSANVRILNDLQDFVQDCHVKRVLCFILTSPDVRIREDPFLSALREKANSVNTTEMHRELGISDSSQKIFSDLQSFLLNKESNERTQETVFVAAYVPDPCSPGSAVHLYQSGSLLSLNVTLDVKPDPAEIIKVQQTRVTMKLQSAEGYRVEYRAVKEDTEWRFISCTGETCVVSGLTPGTHYELRYALMDSKGMSDYSGITAFQTVSRVRPGAPTVLKLNKEEIYIAWQKAEEDDDDEGSLVLSYIVEYLEAGLEGWQSIRTDGPVCECTVTLPDSTCYRARVCAVYANGDTSAPSEETKVPVRVWSIDLSKRKPSVFLEVLRLQTTKTAVKLRDCPDEESTDEVQSFLQCLSYISQLRLCSDVLVRIAQTKSQRSHPPVTLDELFLTNSGVQQPHQMPSKILNSLCFLLKHWKVQCLNLTESNMAARSLVNLLDHQGSLTIRFSEETLQELVSVVYEAQDEDLTLRFLRNVGGDLTSCVLSWDIIRSFLQCHPLTVDVRRSTIREENIQELLLVLDKIQLRGLKSSFVLSVMRKIHETSSAHSVSILLSSTENCINLKNRKLSSADCAALRFTLEHCTGVSLNLLWTSVPEGELESIIPLLSHVSHLRVDRRLLLGLLHCCDVPELHQEAAVLLSALQHKLDFSSYDALDLTADTTSLYLSSEDCRVVSTAIHRAHTHVQVTLQDCEIEDAGVELLFPVLHTVSLRCSKALLLHFLNLVDVVAETERIRRAAALSRALSGEVDLSETRLNLQTCKSLALVLKYSEGLSELDLSHCQLTDQHVEPLLPHLHKPCVIDLSHNLITDASARSLYHIVSMNSHIQTVCLFNNKITDPSLFLKDQRFEIWP